MTTIISYPPGAGGNHLRNIISLSSQYNNNNLRQLYERDSFNVHSSNLPSLTLENIKLQRLLYGHFAEILTYYTEIDQLPNKKFIVIAPETKNDRTLLNNRLTKIKRPEWRTSEYLSSEQFFLYNSDMYLKWFNILPDDIMIIPVSCWFNNDITDIVLHINNFLNIDIDTNRAQELHAIWFNKNLT
jgi:hypothetical protein